MTSEAMRVDGEPDATQASRRRLVLSWTILVATLVVPIALLFAWSRPAFQSNDITGAAWGRDFRLHDADGQVRTIADYRGRVVLLFFGFTQCPDVCPTALARANDVIRRLGQDGERVQVVFVTLDPERDTAALMKAYMQAFNDRFVALRDTQDVTDVTAREFHVFFRRVPTGSSYTLDHTAITYAFDPAGRLRLAIGHQESAAAVAGDVARLLKEGAT